MNTNNLTDIQVKKLKIQLVNYQRAIVDLTRKLRIEKNANKELTNTINTMKREQT